VSLLKGAETGRNMNASRRGPDLDVRRRMPQLPRGHLSVEFCDDTMRKATWFAAWSVHALISTMTHLAAAADCRDLSSLGGEEEWANLRNEAQAPTAEMAATPLSPRTSSSGAIVRRWHRTRVANVN
jgi:hypothetical protein